MVRATAFLIILLASLNVAHAGRVQLSPGEVRGIFIGTPWHSPDGSFLFIDTGTYSNFNFYQKREWGTWPYRMLEDGTLAGGSTHYRFYRDGDKYSVFHTRSGRFYPAYPNRTYGQK